MWPLGIGVALVAFLVLGNYAMWLGRPQASEPETFSRGEAAVYVEMVAPADDGDTIARITSNGQPNEIRVTDAHLIGTAKVPGGDVDLVAFSGKDDAGTLYSCLGTVERLLSGSTCAVGPSDEVQVFWGESATSTDSPFGNGQDRSVTVFNAPTEAVTMFVLLDDNSYVGADVFQGASHLVWPDELGGFGQMVLLDAAGNELYRQNLGA